MFLRAANRKKVGKDHRYFRVAENRWPSSGKPSQRTVLCLGGVNDKRETAWRKTLEVFDDLTSTYLEGAMEENPKVRRSYSRDGRQPAHSFRPPPGWRAVEVRIKLPAPRFSTALRGSGHNTIR
jgi:hypothetical protein